MPLVSLYKPGWIFDHSLFKLVDLLARTHLLNIVHKLLFGVKSVFLDLKALPLPLQRYL